ncbi:hypothetical protein CSUI_002972 [Cystoisospora suis]|uniref:Uncharacterized protein n=1 Tax=Cystoisospora suis TaxID=483139 RepID=A0A2C6L6Y2_9APIC|nr:hypothetical protein CSUI_002972 [Cystoisospora suis]
MSGDQRFSGPSAFPKKNVLFCQALLRCSSLIRAFLSFIYSHSSLTRVISTVALSVRPFPLSYCSQRTASSNLQWAFLSTSNWCIRRGTQQSNISEFYEAYHHRNESPVVDRSPSNLVEYVRIDYSISANRWRQLPLVTYSRYTIALYFLSVFSLRSTWLRILVSHEALAVVLRYVVYIFLRIIKTRTCAGLPFKELFTQRKKRKELPLLCPRQTGIEAFSLFVLSSHV